MLLIILVNELFIDFLILYEKFLLLKTPMYYTIRVSYMIKGVFKIKNKFKLIAVLIFLIIIMPIFTGCPDPNPDNLVMFLKEFKEVSLDGKSELKNEIRMHSDFSSELRYFKVEFVPVGYGQTILYSKHNDEMATKKCYKIGEQASKDAGYYVYPIKVVLTEGRKQQLINKELKVAVTIYEDSSCSSIHKMYYSNKFKVSTGPIVTDLEEVLEAIGGDKHYCNVDSNGNYRVDFSKNIFLDIAYSQIGYKEKSEDTSSKYSCTAHPGTKDYTKYGSKGEWSVAFVHWCLEKSKILSSLPKNVTEMISWAKDNGRWKEFKRGSINEYQPGNLVILNVSGSKMVAIVHKDGYIMGNASNSVKLLTNQDYNEPIGYISLKEITYKN